MWSVGIHMVGCGHWWHTLSGQNFGRWECGGNFWWALIGTFQARLFLCVHRPAAPEVRLHMPSNFTLGPPSLSAHSLHRANNPEIGLKGKRFLAQFHSSFTPHAPLSPLVAPYPQNKILHSSALTKFPSRQLCTPFKHPRQKDQPRLSMLQNA